MDSFQMGVSKNTVQRSVCVPYSANLLPLSPKEKAAAKLLLKALYATDQVKNKWQRESNSRTSLEELFSISALST